MESPYRLDFSEVVAQDIKQILQVARQIGLGPPAKKALREILDTLRNEPNSFGELAPDAEHLHYSERIGIISPLYVRFAVNDENQTVVILNVNLVSS